MRSFCLILPYFSLHLFLLLLTHFTSNTFSLCDSHETSALLQFKNSFAVNTSSKPEYEDPYHPWYGCSSFSFKTESWKISKDCCKWDGVTCDKVSNYVVGLDLSCNNLEGELHPNSTIFKLRHLQQLNFAFNNFSMSSLKIGVGDLINLTYLNLSYCNLSGNIPSTITHLSKLVSLDLSANDMELNPFTWNKLIHNATNLREIYLDGVDMSSVNENSLSMLNNLSSSLVYLSLKSCELQGKLSSGILSLPNLQGLDLSSNKDLSGQLPKSNWSTPLIYLYIGSTAFSGEIPYSIGQLKFLTKLLLSENNFYGMVPLSLWNLTQLIYLDLSHNKLGGELPPLLSNLALLIDCDLRANNFTGNIPNVIGNLTKLQFLTLSSNNLVGQVPSSFFHLPQLFVLDLSFNKLVGPIPSEITKHSKLSVLGLSHNMLNGTIPYWCYYLPSLLELHLDHNHLIGFVAESSTYSLVSLFLSNNNLFGYFPNSTFQLSNLYTLDLSNNNIHGRIPKWFQDLLLNSWKNIELIDLSFNKLQGDLPIPPYGIRYFSLSNNNFTGDVFLSLCNASSLEMLNFAHNKLAGTIPQCIGTFPSLFILDMQMNNLYGSIPINFSIGNQLETIKLNGNQLEGPLPRSLARCTKLEILDLGNNNIDDAFPNWLEPLQELQVLSLRSNKLHGKITCSSTEHSFSKLIIIDISHNNLSGPLPTSCIKNFQGMMNVNDSQIGPQYIGNENYYNDSVVVVMKDFSMELTRILTTFTIIDLSNNMFEGEIPHDIGELISLKGLNLSNNEITGNIPQALSNLRNLEWLDLSRNQLTGEIPTALTNLNFLSVLNLSQNHLEGIIPTGQQFYTFGNSSYEGNTMLCGFPLSKSCKNEKDQPSHSTSEDEEESGFGWKAVVTGYACGAISGLLFGYIVFFIGKPVRLVRFFEHMFNIRLKRTRNRAAANRRRMN